MYIINIRTLLPIVAAGDDRLAGADMEQGFSTIDDAWLRIDSELGTIEAFGPMSSFDYGQLDFHQVIDAAGGLVIPAFCDSHTHMVYAGSRHGEYLDKINGLTYEEIARRGGGILNSADLLHRTSEDELYRSAKERLDEVIAKGTATIEIKSGYGLTVDDELKMLRVISRLKESSAATVRANFLGAHAVGRAFADRKADYVQLIINEMLPAVAAEGLADFVDVFADEGFFSADDTDRILTAAARYGLRPKIHAAELVEDFGAVEVAVRHQALSVDHLERMTDADIDVLRGSRTVATMLPGASFFLRMPYAPFRRAAEAGLTVALASDYNPGSSPSGDMRFVMALACINMRATPRQALVAATLNGAAAMDLGADRGAITPGRRADLIITRPMPALEYITYAYSSPWIARVLIGGKEI